MIIPGSPRVEGDEEEDDTDDLENEFHIANGGDPQNIAEAMFAARLNVGRGSHVNGSGITTPSELDAASVATEIPLLTYGQEVDELILMFVIIAFLSFVMLLFMS